jgi:DNA-binding Lrp family transcriptional regulator
VLDKIDRQVVHLLQEDGRMSTREMAQRLDCISARAIRFRLERLRHDKVVNITALVNTTRLGLPVMGDVLLDIMPWKYAETVARLRSDDRVCYIASSSDRRQISLQLNGRDRADLMRILGQILGLLDGVTAVHVVPLEVLIRDVSDWVAPSD